VPGDAVATLGAARNRRALAHFREVLEIPVTPAARVRLDKE
jgi:hypothetical protein